MKFSDYFSKNFETKEDHMYDTLRTHYYRSRLDEAKKEVMDLIEREKGRVIDDNEKYSEIYYETPNYNCTVTLIVTTPVEVAIDFRVTTYDLISFGKGKKVIEKLYKDLDSKLSFKGISLYK